MNNPVPTDIAMAFAALTLLPRAKAVKHDFNIGDIVVSKTTPGAHRIIRLTDMYALLEDTDPKAEVLFSVSLIVNLSKIPTTENEKAAAMRFWG